MDPDNPFDNSGNDLPDFVLDAPAEEPEPEIVEEVEPVTTPEPAQADDLVEAQTPEEEQAPTEEEAPPPKAWAGKYQSAEELEKGYRELRDLQRRTAERAKAYEQRGSEIEARARQLEDALRRAIPYVQQVTQRAQQPQDPYGEPLPQPSLTPDMVVPMVQQQVAAGVQAQMAQLQQQQAEQARQQAEYREAEQNFKSFFEKHPEVEPDGPLDTDIAATIAALDQAWEPTGSSIDITSSDALEIAYEAAKRPALRQVLELNPAYIDTDAGMLLARRLASEIDGLTQEVPAQGRNTAPRPNTPVVERGSSQAPQAGTPLDEFDQAVAEHRKAISSRGSEIFFGG